MSDITRREFLGLAAISFASRALAIQTGRSFPGSGTFNRLVLLAAREHWAKLSIGVAAARCGLALAGTPYVGSTLEIDDVHEDCVLNFEGLDCVTFYESALGFARMIHTGGGTPADLIRQITKMRYRDGKLDGYLSRLHYTSDWIYDNARKGVVTDLTPSLTGATRMEKSFDFMSRHPDSYRQLKANPSLVPKMADIEKAISKRKPWYVPSDKVEAIEPLLYSGDIVGIATTMDGLDCSHTGLVYVDEHGVRRFLNASSVQKKVVLGERLSEYANKYKRNLGVMIARPVG